MPHLPNALKLFKCDTDHRFSTTYHQSLNPQQVFGKCIIHRMANVMATTGTLRWYLMLDGDLVLGPVTGTYYCLFKKEISNIPTVTPSLFTQTHGITRHNVSVTRYKSVIKNGHDWSPASTLENVSSERDHFNV